MPEGSQEASAAREGDCPPCPADWRCPSTDLDQDLSLLAAPSAGSHLAIAKGTASDKPAPVDTIPCVGNAPTYAGTANGKATI